MARVTVDSREQPPRRYSGVKLDLSPWVRSAIRDRDEARLGDLPSGSSVVIHKGRDVWYVVVGTGRQLIRSSSLNLEDAIDGALGAVAVPHG